MGPRRLFAALILLGSLALGGCRATEGVVSAEFDPTLDGRLYVSAGSGEYSSDLFELHLDPTVRLYRLTETNRVFGISACPENLVVTRADEGVDFADVLSHFEDGEFVPIPGLADPGGSLPSVGADCQLAYVRIDKSTDPSTERVYRVDPGGSLVEVHSADLGQRSLGAVEWGPDGSLSIAEGTPEASGRPGRPEVVVIIAPDGQKRTIPAPVTQFRPVRWAPSPTMALWQDDHTVFLDPATGATSRLEGWVPLAWSPDAERLLVTDAETNMRLGLVERATPTRVRRLGSVSKVAITDAVWLPDDAPAGGGYSTDKAFDGEGL